MRTTIAVAIAVLAAAAGAQAEGRASRLIGAGAGPANPRAGAPVTRLPPGWSARHLADGSDPLENPAGQFRSFGYVEDAPVPEQGCRVRTHAEPDEHTYLVLGGNPGGPTPGYDYGRRFLFQGHELTNFRSFITRINLDVEDPAHRITLLTPPGSDGKTTGWDQMDGSTWNPFSRTLLFTMESSSVGPGGLQGGGVTELSATWPPSIRNLYGSIGHGDFEGIHPDHRGRLFIAEDKGGPKVRVVRDDPSSPVQARQPNGFIYRFTPDHAADLSRGLLEALQVLVDGAPVTFHAADPLGDVFSEGQRKLHVAGSRWPARWVAVHDTAADGDAPFKANDLARARGATPFKRPENLQFLPGSKFNTFFFAPTGDTNSLAGDQPELAARGAYGSIFRVDLEGDDAATLSIVFLGDREHNSFDNLAFADDRTLLAAEDRGDTLHAQLDTLDSIWAFDVGKRGEPPVRFVALGRDDESLLAADCAAAGTPTQNDADNEPTGVHISTGNPSIHGLQGARRHLHGARWFLTQQHGRNTVYELIPPSSEDGGGGDD